MVPSPTTGTAEPSFHDVPSAAELLEAVREWVEGDARHATTGRVQFHTRVVANVMAMLERELESGPAMAVGPRGPPGGVGRVVRGRPRRPASGPASGRWTTAALLDAVRATVVDKLAVANPKYL